MGFKPMPFGDYTGPVSVIHCERETYELKVSSGTVGASGYDASTKEGWCVAPVLATRGVAQWVGLHYLSRATSNDCIRFTKQMCVELRSNDFDSRPPLPLVKADTAQ